MEKKMKNEMESRVYIRFYMGGFPKLGVPCEGPNNKDYKILGVYIGVSLF